VWSKFLHFLQSESGLRAAIAISLGAIPGALARYYITLGMVRWLGANFPYGTLVVNLTGAMLMGGIMTFFLQRNLPFPELRLLLTTGFLGAYTTFSTYTLEIHTLLRGGSYTKGILYGAGSLIVGVLGCELGSHLARRWP
jgi:CrcB protein